MSKPLAHSFSALKTYENCPLKYYHTRVAKTVRDVGGAATIHGEVVHKGLENFLLGKEELSDDLSHVEDTASAVKDATKQGFSLHVEQKLTLTENLTPTSWFAGDAWMRSILDVNLMKGDRAIVMDWKTGKRRPDFFQLSLFALQVFEHFPEINHASTAFIWLKEGEVDRGEFYRSDKDKLWEEVMTRVRRIERSVANDQWPAKPSGLCRFCPAQQICKFGS